MRTRRAPETARQEILEAARSEIESSPNGQASVSAVMRRVGMKQSSFYHYFQTLDDVVLELLLDLEAEIQSAVEPWLKGRATSSNPRSATVEHLTKMLVAGQRNHKIVGAAIRSTASSEKVYTRWKSRVMDFYFEAAREFIQKEVTEGRSRVSDPAGVARALVLMNFGAWMDDLWRDNPADPAQLARTIGAIWNDVIYGTAHSSQQR